MKPPTSLDMVVQDMAKALDQDLPYAALMLALTIPHICPALETENNRSDGREYKDWYSRYVAKYFNNSFSTEDCYSLRCGMIHQGQSIIPGEILPRTRAMSGNEKRKVIFLINSNPNQQFHGNEIGGVKQFDLRFFCQSFIYGMTDWWENKGTSEAVEKNLELLLRCYSSCKIMGIEMGPVIA